MKAHSSGYNLTAKVGHITLNYDDQGHGDIPVILIHGFPFDKNMWRPQVKFLKESHRVIAYDIRGFGRSMHDGVNFCMELFAYDLIKLMDALKLPKASICGLSMGGYIALHAIKHYPERFEKLILADTQCVADTAEAKENRYKTIKIVEEKGIQDFAEAYLKKVFHKDSLIDKKDYVDAIKKAILATPMKTITGTITALAEREDTCGILNDIHIPTLIICGRQDEPTPVKQSEAMHQQVKGSVLKVIEHAGHLSNLEQADEFNEAISEFLKD
jgi:pimeloyl-ACP methyl ester carboxylesterase